MRYSVLFSVHEKLVLYLLLDLKDLNLCPNVAVD